VAWRRVRLPGLVLVVHMARDAAGRRSGKRMVARKMARYATGDRAANAAFAVNRRCRGKADRNRDRKRGMK
jgi:hypothetical protein